MATDKTRRATDKFADSVRSHVVPAALRRAMAATKTGAPPVRSKVTLRPSAFVKDSPFHALAVAGIVFTVNAHYRFSIDGRPQNGGFDIRVQTGNRGQYFPLLPGLVNLVKDGDKPAAPKRKRTTGNGRKRATVAAVTAPAPASADGDGDGASADGDSGTAAS
jgi:hypothetical protein